MPSFHIDTVKYKSTHASTMVNIQALNRAIATFRETTGVPTSHNDLLRLVINRLRTHDQSTATEAVFVGLCALPSLKEEYASEAGQLSRITAQLILPIIPKQDYVGLVANAIDGDVVMITMYLQNG